MQSVSDWNYERTLSEYLKGVDGVAGRVVVESEVLDDCENNTEWSGYAPVSGNEPTITAGATNNRTGTNAIKIAWANTSLNSAGVLTIAAAKNLAKWNFMGFWAIHDETDNTNYDAVGDVTIEFYDADGNLLGTYTCPAFRAQGVVHYIEVALADVTLETGRVLNTVKTIRFIKGVTEGENAKALFIDHIELYQVSAGYPVRTGGVIRAFPATGTFVRGNIAEIADPVIGTVQAVTDNSKVAIGKFCNSGTGGTAYVLVWGISTLQANEAMAAGEGCESAGTTDLVDDGGADTTDDQIFAKALEAAAAQYDHFMALIGVVGEEYTA